MDCSCEGGGNISLGPWGNGSSGNEFRFRPKGGIKQIIIRHNDIVDSIVFKGAIDGDYSTKIGGDGGKRTVKIDIDSPSEFLTGISGTHGGFWFCGHVVRSLRFQTNITKYGPFGVEDGTPFSIYSEGGVITGFHGRCAKFVDSIGIYLAPVCTHKVEMKAHSGIGPSRLLPPPPSPPPPRSAGPWGGNGGSDWDDGCFSGVKVVHVRLCSESGAVCAVRFSYSQKDGSDFVSPFHGRYSAGDKHGKTIVFGKEGEELIGIEGFHGEGIKSLTFITNKGKYGPVGDEMGTHFSSMPIMGDCNRKVVGFHGRSSAHLDAIGLHTHYF